MTGIDADGVTMRLDNGVEQKLPAPHRGVGRGRPGLAARPRPSALPLDKNGRVLVNPDLSIPGHDEVFVVGDLASLVEDGRARAGPVPAGDAGRRADRRQHPAAHRAASRTVPFHYKDKGSLATIGRAAAVGEVFGWKVSGFVAWFMWAFVHLLFLIGFRNRIFVFLSWAWSYLTFSRGARLITNLDPRLLPPPKP